MKDSFLEEKTLFGRGAEAPELRTRGCGVREATVPFMCLHEISFLALRVSELWNEILFRGSTVSKVSKTTMFV